MCDYCDLSNYKKCEPDDYDYCPHDMEYEIAKAPYTGLDITYYSQTNKFALVAYGDYDAGIDIEYCPFCGRKLTEENNNG